MNATHQNIFANCFFFFPQWMKKTIYFSLKAKIKITVVCRNISLELIHQININLGVTILKQQNKSTLNTYVYISSPKLSIISRMKLNKNKNKKGSTFAILISSSSSWNRLLSLENLLMFCWSSQVTSVSDPPAFN